MQILSLTLLQVVHRNPNCIITATPLANQDVLASTLAVCLVRLQELHGDGLHLWCHNLLACYAIIFLPFRPVLDIDLTLSEQIIIAFLLCSSKLLSAD